MLKFDSGRRLLLALLIIPVLILAFVAGMILGPLWGISPGWVAVAAVILLAVPVVLLEAVTLA